MSFSAKIDIRTRFTIILAVTSLLFLIVFSVVVYSQAKKKSFDFAQSSLLALIEHEWEHLDLPKHQTQMRATPHFKDVYLRIWKGGVLLYDSFPKGFPDEFPPGGDLAKDKLFHSLSKEHNGHAYELQGFYDLTSANAYLSFLRNILIVSCILAAVILVPVSFLSTRILLKPFRELATSTSKLTPERLTFRFEESATKDEYGILVRNFNDLLDRIEKSFLQTKRFALNASHELRTPLAVIISQGEMALRKERDSKDYRTALEKMVQPAKRLREIVNRLLFLAELDRLEQEKDIEEIDVEIAINALALTIKDAYGGVRKTVRVINSNGSASFVGNREVFDVVVGNLIENAYKFSQGSIDVTYKKTESGLVLNVEDDGPGISDEYLGTILEPLAQTPNIQPNLGKRGAGLGLTIVKACLDSIKGSMELSKSSKGGLSARVIFPQPKSV